MPSQPSLLDRVLKRIVPRPVAEFAPPPRELAPDLWVLDRQLRFPGGLRLPCRTTIVRLRSGGLVVISPPPLDPSSTLAGIEGIGIVRDVVAPNSFHYVYAADLLARADARLLVAPGLPERVDRLPAAEPLGPRPPEAWDDELDLAVLGPVNGFSEVAFFHSPTGALILTDLAFNLTRFNSPLERLAWRLNGMPAGFGPGRTSRMLLLRDRERAKHFLRRVAEWPIGRIVVAHGEAIDRDAQGQFERAFASYL